MGLLWAEAASAAFVPLLPPDHTLPDPQPERLRERLDDPEVSVLLAAENERPVGFVACGRNRDPDPEPWVGEIQSLFVGSAHWRRGIARALIEAALDDLRERGYSMATVWSFADNHRANAFYESQGFARDGAEVREQVWADLLQVRYRRALA